MSFLFRNLRLLDPRWDEARPGWEVLVEGELIMEVSDRPINAASASTIDCGGRTLMPGLIDCHVHVIHSEVNIRFLEAMPLTLLTARAATRLKAMLDRGFTTVRDTGGCDWGIKEGVAQGHLVGPRLFIAGQSIGPPGGHSDGRRRTDYDAGGCACCNQHPLNAPPLLSISAGRSTRSKVATSLLSSRRSRCGCALPRCCAGATTPPPPGTPARRTHSPPLPVRGGWGSGGGCALAVLGRGVGAVHQIRGELDDHHGLVELRPVDAQFP